MACYKFEALKQSWAKRRAFTEAEKTAPQIIKVDIDHFRLEEGKVFEVRAQLDNGETIEFSARLHANWTYELGKDKDDPSQITSWGLQGLGEFDHIGIQVLPD